MEWSFDASVQEVGQELCLKGFIETGIWSTNFSVNSLIYKNMIKKPFGISRDVTNRRQTNMEKLSRACLAICK
jgi:hypothetical protein